MGSLFFSFIFWIMTSFPKIGVLLLGSVAAVFGGVAPDLIEPATWPGYRGIFHWLGFLAIFPVLLLFPSTNILEIVIAFFFPWLFFTFYFRLYFVKVV